MSWMQTISGRKFFPTDIKKSEFHICDIAHALSQLNRFGGHARFPYSVAQHSVLVSEIVEELGGHLDTILLGLMHDATEAYLVDVPSPIKPLLRGYKDLENWVFDEIVKQLDLPTLDTNDIGLPHLVKEADGIALVTEASQLVVGDVSDWPAFKQFAAWPVKIQPMHWMDANKLFLDRYMDLTTRRADIA